jgi:hypothetical protein
MSDEQNKNGDKQGCGCGDAAPKASPQEATSADRDCAKQQADELASQQRGQQKTIDFATFMFSMATQALALMGEAQIPGHNLPKDLPAAKQTIDILEMLERKTRGNLTESEAKLLSNLLYDLRVRYVRSTRAEGGK